LTKDLFFLTKSIFRLASLAKNQNFPLADRRNPRAKSTPRHSHVAPERGARALAKNNAWFPRGKMCGKKEWEKKSAACAVLQKKVEFLRGYHVSKKGPRIAGFRIFFARK